MKYLLFIMALLLMGCAAGTARLSQGEGASQPKAEWLQCGLKGGCSAADEYVAAMQKLKCKEPEDADFDAARQILDNAIASGKCNKDELAILQYDCIINDYLAFAWASHRAFSKDLANEVNMHAALDTAARLLAIRNNPAPLAADELKKQMAWEHSNDDWAGADWSGLFAGRKPLQALVNTFMLRYSENGEALAVEDIEQWKKSKEAEARLHELCQAIRKGKDICVMQTIELQEVPEGARIYLNLHAFPGRCVLFQNGAETGRYSEPGLITLSVPLNFDQNRQCRLAIVIPKGFEKPGADAQHAPWPAWFSMEKPSGK